MNSSRAFIALLSASIAIAIAISGCATPGDGAKWTCSAAGLVSANYDGSEYANVQLQGFSRTSPYKVTLDAQRTKATGTTANGTPFTCVKAT
jgi:hypothetical protein